MALFRGPRFSHVVIGVVLGVVACGAAVSLAGPTPWPPAEPIDELPDDIEVVREFACGTDLLSSLMALTTTTVEQVGPTAPRACWRIAVVTAPDETSNEVADRLAQHFTAEGFVFRGQAAGPERSYLARQPACGTILAIDTGPLAINTPPGSRALAAPPADPGTPQPGVVDPAGGAPAPTDGPGATGGGAPDPAGSEEAVPPPSKPLRDVLTSVSEQASIPSYLMGNARPGAVIVSTQQSFSVKPAEAGSAC